MTTTAPFYLGPDALAPAHATAVLGGAYAAAPDVGVVEVAGPGAVACMQGMLTCDVEKPGEGGFVYGALLTPKGMIVTDLWAERDRASVRLTVPAAGRAALLHAFAQALPPRLARVTERTEELAVLRLAGPRALEVAAAAGLAAPAPGRWSSAIAGEAACSVARPEPGAPFVLQVVTTPAQRDALGGRLAAAGVSSGDTAGLELARILAGWPRLDAEIDGRTLPQEVRYDEIGGVSYTKGCYTGQETVARIHFRGHPNRLLRGLNWRTPPDRARSDVLQDDQPRGRVTSVAWVEPLDRYLGLGVLRREVDLRQVVMAGGAEAEAFEPPFPLPPRGER